MNECNVPYNCYDLPHLKTLKLGVVVILRLGAEDFEQTNPSLISLISNLALGVVFLSKQFNN